MYIFLASNSEWKIYRKLYSFESAYVSLKRIIGSVEELSNQLRLVLIRNYWNPLIDEELLNVSQKFDRQLTNDPPRVENRWFHNFMENH